MSFATQAIEKSADAGASRWQNLKDKVKNVVMAPGKHNKSDFGPFEGGMREGAGKATGAAVVAGTSAAALYGAHKLHKALQSAGSFDRMAAHAGEGYTQMDDKQKTQARKYFNAIAKHSPTVASDPIASWNHVRYFIEHPTSYQPATIEALRKVETATPSFFGRK